MSTHESPESASLPVAPVDRWLAPVTRFLHVEASSGVVLLACTALALAIANSPLAGWFASLWKTPVSLSVGPFMLSGDVVGLIRFGGHLPKVDGMSLQDSNELGDVPRRRFTDACVSQLARAMASTAPRACS